VTRFETAAAGDDRDDEMSDALRGYVETRGRMALPALTIRRWVSELGAPDADGIRRLAADTGLPEASVRAVVSYYDDLRADPAALRVCRGTSCLLAGAGDLERRLAAKKPCRGVFCLGYCDHSPAVLRADGRVVTRCADRPSEEILGADAPPAPTPVVRCLAPEPVVTRRLLQGDASNLIRARFLGAYGALEHALTSGPEAVLDEMERSGERGRGGAGFPTARKWRLAAAAPGPLKYVVANGDEGDPGSFVDRVLMEHDPHAVIEGILICAFAVGAREAIVFVRSEYPRAVAVMEAAIGAARAAGILGSSVMGSEFACDVTVFPALGSYVCGEETALLNAIEGFRGEVRLRPPYPVEAGLHGRPTVVNNVETLVNVPWIVGRGADAYAALGTGASPGTKVLCLNHGFTLPGLYEVEHGIPLEQVLEAADGAADGHGLAALAVGGPMGSLVFPEDWDVPVCHAAMRERGLELGHGGIVAIPEDADPAALLVHWLEFMQHESCGRCVPCRIGSQRALELARHAAAGDLDGDGRERLGRLLEVMTEASLCAFGRNTPRPMKQIVERFGDRIFGGAT
jgi:NADH:ubiquinone oxidoreductase subunit F (NADH-binding)/NADH:ubiquinone oxidoreductase subunit E